MGRVPLGPFFSKSTSTREERDRSDTGRKEGIRVEIEGKEEEQTGKGGIEGRKKGKIDERSTVINMLV
jgi:hypothetical protein